MEGWRVGGLVRSLVEAWRSAGISLLPSFGP